MLWFTVWALLVVATLVGAGLLVRRVYRSGRALLSELTRAAEVFAEVTRRADELAAAAAQRNPVAPVDLSDPGPARARLAETSAATQRRRAARAARHEQVQQRWLDLSR